MWNEIKPTLIELIKSKKFYALLAGVIVAILSSFGLGIPEEKLTEILMFIGTYILGQGLADFRKHGDQALADSLGKLSDKSKEN